MTTPRACATLEFLGNNIESRIDTIQEARKFVRDLKLTDVERLFLECAFRNQSQMKAFYSRFVLGLNGD